MGRATTFTAAGATLLVAVALTVAGVGESDDAFPNWQALVLGVVQGLTELLPISSSGHLIIVPWLGEWHYLEENPDFNKTFDVALHLGTLVAVVAYFWEDILRLIAAWLRSVRRRAIGTAQALALMPGVSRSGITITAGRFLKLDRDSAARLSFLLLVPIVFGAVLFKGMTDVVFGSLPSGSIGPFLVGTI